MTAQFHEKLILEGEETSMTYFPPIPSDHPDIKSLTYNELSKFIHEGKISSLVRSTACWRNYIGTWEIKDGKLYLIEIKGRFYYDGDEPIFADWVTGEVVVPHGEILRYIHMGVASVYEYETRISIINGLAIEEKVIDNRDENQD